MWSSPGLSKGGVCHLGITICHLGGHLESGWLSYVLQSPSPLIECVKWGRKNRRFKVIILTGPGLYQLERYLHRRRMYTEEKTTVIAASWGGRVPCRASYFAPGRFEDLADMNQVEWKNMVQISQFFKLIEVAPYDLSRPYSGEMLSSVFQFVLTLESSPLLNSMNVK